MYQGVHMPASYIMRITMRKARYTAFVHTTVFTKPLSSPMVPRLHTTFVGSLQQLVGATRLVTCLAQLLLFQSAMSATPQQSNWMKIEMKLINFCKDISYIL